MPKCWQNECKISKFWDFVWTAWLETVHQHDDVLIYFAGRDAELSITSVVSILSRCERKEQSIPAPCWIWSPVFRSVGKCIWINSRRLFRMRSTTVALLKSKEERRTSETFIDREAISIDDWINLSSGMVMLCSECLSMLSCYVNVLRRIDGRHSEEEGPDEDCDLGLLPDESPGLHRRQCSRRFWVLARLIRFRVNLTFIKTTD